MLTLILFVVLGALWTLKLKSHIKSCNKTVTRELWTTLGDSSFLFGFFFPQLSFLGSSRQQKTACFG